MAKKLDGILEAVRYNTDGSIQMARIYERRGPTWSDRVLLDRDTLLARLKAGKRFAAGQRQAFMGGTFDTAKELRVFSHDGSDYIHTVGQKAADARRDHLDGVPQF